MVAASPTIELRRIYRYFGETCAVGDVSFEVREGEVFGYIGPNGAGKTTSMRILSTLDLPSMGDAIVDGFSVINDPDKVRKRIGFMPDSFGTYSNVNCEEYLDFFARSYGLVGKDRRRALRNVMSFTQLDRIADKPINGLSKGMKQRLCLSRALVHNPKVLILDEPAAGLDPRARIELRDMIGELASQGKSLLISSHILTELAEMCDRVAILEMGRLLATGTVDEILANLQQQQSANSSEETSASAIVQIEVEVVENILECQKWLDAIPEISGTNIQQNRIHFDFGPQQEDRADLLAAMINAGFRVSDFTVKERTLEEAFLHVTKGRIQ